MEASGKLFHKIAEKLTLVDTSNLPTKVFKKGHQLSITSIAIAIPKDSDSKSKKPIYFYTASKDASIVKWDFYSGKKLATFPGGLKRTKKVVKTVGLKHLKSHVGHHDHILALAASSDGKFLVSIFNRYSSKFRLKDLSFCW